MCRNDQAIYKEHFSHNIISIPLDSMPGIYVPAHVHVLFIMYMYVVYVHVHRSVFSTYLLPLVSVCHSLSLSLPTPLLHLYTITHTHTCTHIHTHTHTHTRTHTHTQTHTHTHTISHSECDAGRSCIFSCRCYSTCVVGKGANRPSLVIVFSLLDTE